MKIKIAFLTTQDKKKNPQMGDCIVVTYDEIFDGEKRKACIVIDGGRKTNSVVLKKHLEKKKIKIIDLVVATHVDNDHIYGLLDFLAEYVCTKKEFELRNYWGPAPKTYDPMSITEFLSYIEGVDQFGIDELSFISQGINENEELYNTIRNILADNEIFHPSVLNRGDIPRIFNNIELEILAPDIQIPASEIQAQKPIEESLGNDLISDSLIDLSDVNLGEKVNEAAQEYDRTANNQSIVIKLIPLDRNGRKIKNCSFLFTGDAEIDSWKEMISQGRKALKSRVLKISHHGSKNGTTAAVLKAVKPKYCVICAGHNTYKLPNREVLEMIDEEQLEIFCTGRNPKAKESPCVGKRVLKKCPRWNNTRKKHVKETITFTIDTEARTLMCSENPCGFKWADLS